MHMAGRIVLATLGLTAPEALADHHGMAMEPSHGSVIGTSVSLLAASFATPDFAGDYEGVIPSLSWSTPRYVLGANLPLYRLQENGRELYGRGDAVIHGQGTFVEAGEVHAGGLLAVTFPTGDGEAGTGMGHAMAMPALWSAWTHARVTVAGSAGYSRALVGSMSNHNHGPWPLVEPMNMSEISWSAAAERSPGGKRSILESYFCIPSRHTSYWDLAEDSARRAGFPDTDIGRWGHRPR